MNGSEVITASGPELLDLARKGWHVFSVSLDKEMNVYTYHLTRKEEEVANDR